MPPEGPGWSDSGPSPLSAVGGNDLPQFITLDNPLGTRRSQIPHFFGIINTGEKSPGHGWSWAALMQRAFAFDVLACPHCGGRLRLIATLHDPAGIRKLLAHLGMVRPGASPGPAPPEPGAAAS